MASLVRQAVYYPVASDATYPNLAELDANGWQLRRVRESGALKRLLQAEDCLVGLLDLRGHLQASDLSALPALLRADRVGWLALVDSAQLQQPVVRALVRDHCFDYLTLPCPEGMLSTLAGHALGMSMLVASAPAREPADEGMLGRCAAMQALRRALRKAALSDAPVFIDGETGTGKELAAQAIHRHSARHARPFIAVNCGAIAPSLVQSELFGHERGAFTGAQQRKIGRIEHANGGTLFLDEIGDLPLECQASLLRFLQEGTFERVGGHEPIRVHVRIVSATHQDLVALIAAGSFRADLYHRLCVLHLRQPPLRERGDDILLLAEHALQRYGSEGGRRIHGFSACAIQAMHRYPWPGNVRELINRVRQAVVMWDGRMITAQSLHLSDGDSLVDHAGAGARRCRSGGHPPCAARQRQPHQRCRPRPGHLARDPVPPDGAPWPARRPGRQGTAGHRLISATRGVRVRTRARRGMPARSWARRGSAPSPAAR